MCCEQESAVWRGVWECKGFPKGVGSSMRMRLCSWDPRRLKQQLRSLIERVQTSCQLPLAIFVLIAQLAMHVTPHAGGACAFATACLETLALLHPCGTVAASLAAYASIYLSPWCQRFRLNVHVGIAQAKLGLRSRMEACCFVLVTSGQRLCLRWQHAWQPGRSPCWVWR